MRVNFSVISWKEVATLRPSQDFVGGLFGLAE